MNELLDRILDAHGGVDRWKRYENVEATIVSGGGLFALKGVPQDAAQRRRSGRRAQYQARATQACAFAFLLQAVAKSDHGSGNVCILYNPEGTPIEPPEIISRCGSALVVFTSC